MKTAISIPDDLFAAAERATRRLGVSRSELYQRALTEFLEKREDAAITSALDQVYSVDPDASKLDPVLETIQRASLPKEAW